jgi:hypothetical protein
MKPPLIALGCLAVSCTLARFATAAEWSVPSPDGKIVLTVWIAERGATLEYRLTCAGSAVLEPSPMGISRDHAALVAGLSLVSAGEVVPHDSTYANVHGKRRVVRDRHNNRTLIFRNADRAQVELELRISDDGAAFRYRFPDESVQPVTVHSERTGFRLPAGSKVWSLPYDDPSEYTPAYEAYWEDGIPAGTPSPKAAGWALPLLFQTGGGRWGLIAEAAVDGSYCGSRLEREAPDGLYLLRFPEAGDGNGTGAVKPSSKTPWATPWRVIVAGTSLAPIVESTLIDDLNPPSAVADTSWIRPGRVSWSWLSDPPSPQDFNKLKAFVDLAADMGWEYTLVDANWDLMRNGTVQDLIAYAKSKGVGVFLWYNSGGPHNVVTERPRGLMDLRKVRRFEFERLARWGVKGVKIDFFQSDKQNIMGLYHDILKDAADFKIMVNFHGCTMPRGWSRTYPHLMSMEAVRGEECYLFDSKFPGLAPRHNATLPFTRNAVGPMDYTPTMFQDNRHPLQTTPAHEIALPIVFESGLLHFAGGPDDYRRLQPAARDFLRNVPVAWDETRFVDGFPGKLAVIARRSGVSWYVGAVEGEGRARDYELKPSFLGPGIWTATILEDGDVPRSPVARTVRLRSDGPLRIPLRARGGFVAVFAPQV